MHVTGKISEDLTFKKLKTPSVYELFSKQYQHQKPNGDFLLYYLLRYETNRVEVRKCFYSEISTLFDVYSVYEYVSMEASMPLFKFIKKD